MIGDVGCIRLCRVPSERGSLEPQLADGSKGLGALDRESLETFVDAPKFVLNALSETMTGLFEPVGKCPVHEASLGFAAAERLDDGGLGVAAGRSSFSKRSTPG